MLVTHSREVAARADRVLTIEDGHLLGLGRPRRVLSPTLLRTGLRDLVRRPLQTGLLVLGVALGVAVVIAIDLANESARRGFDRSSEAIMGRATHQIRGRPLGRAGGCLPPPARGLGLRPSTPVVEGVALAPDLDRQPLTVLGVDPLSEGPFRSHLAGRRVAAAASRASSTSPRRRSSAAALADRYGLAPGRGSGSRSTTASRPSASWASSVARAASRAPSTGSC